jgi:serine/threonine protein kinase
VIGPGSRIGPFHIERELGRGGMGVVYLARDTKLDRHVAIKSIPPENEWD